MEKIWLRMAIVGLKCLEQRATNPAVKEALQTMIEFLEELAKNPRMLDEG